MSSNGGRPHSADVVILTAIPLEYEAALQVDTGAVEGSHWEEERFENGLRVSFRPFRGKKDGRPLRVALVAAGGMGAVEATQALLPAVLEYRPRCVAMCGVCAGHPRKTNLGDVIAPDRLFFHDTGKRRPEGVQQDLTTYNLRYDWKEDLKHFDFVARFKDAPWWRARPVPYEWQEAWALLKLHEGVTQPWTLPDFEHLCPQWEKVIDGLWTSGQVQPQGSSLTDKGRERLKGLLLQHRGRLPDLSPTGKLLPFRVHVEPMGSGSQVIEDVTYWDTVAGYMRKTVGLEMEAAALGALAHAQSHLKLDALVMKGVMDFANHGRDDHFKEYAARASAECLLAFLREHLDVEVVPGVDDLLRTGSAGEPPANAPPSALLNARHEVVPFHGREALLAELGRWCDEGPPVAVQLLHAEGGVGKTRLAIELVRRRREQGWSAGFLAKEVPENWLERLWSLGQPVLVVLDYAESHPGLHSLLSRLLQYAAQQGTAALRRIRFLLLARNDGDWWKSLHQRDTELGTWLGTATVHELPPLAMSAAERAQVFHEAAERFAAKLGKPHRPKATAPGLDDEHFQRVLYVHMAALAAVEGLAFEANTLMDITLDHEERFWDIRAGQALTGLVVQRSLARQLVAAATLRGGLADKEEADAILARLLGHSSSGLADEALLLRLLHWVYQRTGGSPSEFLPALEPDLLGEAMVLRVASAQPFSGEQVPSDWIDRVFPPLPDDSGHALGNGLQVLGRASATRPTVIRPWLERLLSGPLLRTRAPMALDAAKAVGQRTAFSVLGDVLAERLQVEGDVEQARQLQAMEIPFSSVSLGRVSEWVIRTQLNAQPNPQNGQALAERASLVGNLGNTLNALGRWEEALQATEEAVAICRKLAENSPEHYQPDLALAFNNLSIMLKDMGRWEEALEAASEAVAFYRQLTESGADEFLHGLAGSLNNLSNVLTTLGRRQEALKVSLEAVQMRRRLVENNAEDSQFGLASALGNLGSCLKNAGQREEALKASVEAVALFRGLAERNADVVQPELASSLNNLSIMLKELGRHQEALRASTEAVSLHRRLAERNADAFQPSLANSLYNLGSILHDLGRMKDALEVTVESVQLRQLLAKRNALVSTPALAGSFVNLGAMLHGLGRREEALEAAHKGVVLHRELAERNAEAFLPPLAESLNNLGVMLLELGQREAALKIANEAVRLRRMLVQRDAGAFQDGLAGSLLNLGLVLKGLGRHEEALTAIHEALDKSWPHFLSLPDRYRLNTGRMLFQLNAIHEALQRPLPAELQERLATFERLTGA